MVIAHRGYAKTAQENTLSAFDAAIKAGAKGIECDVRLTKDKKAIINHNSYILLNGEKIKIAKHFLQELVDVCKSSGHKLVLLDDLFKYAKRTKVQVFLELKSSSKALTEAVIEKIEKAKMWEQVQIMGFTFFLKNALKAQSKYPKLRIGQLLRFPPYAYLKKPKKSYSVFLGWLDGLRGSQTVFRTLMSPKRLTKLKKYFEKHGFKVMGGVINNKKGLDLFKQAGITDIVTDRVPETVKYFSTND